LAVQRGQGRQGVLALHNLSPEPQRIGPTLKPWLGAKVRDILRDEPMPPVSGRAYSLTLAPFEYRWLNLELD
jgi:hypothetical protein